MSKLEQLITEFCPDGVEYYRLDEVVDLTMGTSPDGKTISADPTGVEFHQGKSFFDRVLLQPSGVYTSAPVKLASAGSIIMSVRAPVGDSNMTDREIAIGRGLCAMKGKDGLDTKFLYYFIDSSIQEIKKKSSGSTFESINTNDIKGIMIPLPPLPVQQEIVRILDKFTELEAELEAELVARTKQYEYYRDELLTFGDDVKLKMLGEIADIYDSLHQTPNYVDKGYSMIRVTDVKSGYIDTTKTLKVDYGTYLKFTKNYEPKYNDIVFSRVGSYGNFSLVGANEKCCLGQNTSIIHPRILNKYVYYYLNSKAVKTFIDNNINGGSQKTFSLKNIKIIPMAVPSITEQERIVAFLDRFDALVNDITTGLPAEIAARRKQYEYYRDKLLTFRECQG